MNPEILGKKYDRIATWWNDNHKNSNYGMSALERAIRYTSKKVTALDVGCGSGGRMIRKLIEEGFRVTGVDVSEEMIKLAMQQHAGASFYRHDFSTWQTNDQYDLVMAWDSIFHLPHHAHEHAVSKMCKLLKPDGVVMYTFGNAVGEHESEWMEDTFYYSSIGIEANLKILSEHNVECWHLELDQYPEKHVVVIGKKRSS